MKGKLFVPLATGLALLSVTAFIASRASCHTAGSAVAAAPGSITGVLVAGPGRVEPSSEDIKIGSELSGKLKAVLVEEGDHVHRGQVLAVLVNDDFYAEVLSARAKIQMKEATLRKVLNGARKQERSEALATVRAARAVMENAKAEMERRQKLYESGVISRENLESSTRAYNVSKENYEEATERYSLVDDRARQEDLDFAQSDLQLAKTQLQETQARYEKTFIRSPIDGTVLRKHHRDGESVSNSSTVPDPILTIGNKDVLHVRVDVDETEVSRVRVGQKAYVTADAYGKEKFWGRVIRVGEQLGPKNIRTDAPSERVDTKILETLVELDKGTSLPMGLRVDAYIVTDDRH